MILLIKIFACGKGFFFPLCEHLLSDLLRYEKSPD